jgi:hypothetical protein
MNDKPYFYWAVLAFCCAWHPPLIEHVKAFTGGRSRVTVTVKAWCKKNCFAALLDTKGIYQ